MKLKTLVCAAFLALSSHSNDSSATFNIETFDCPLAKALPKTASTEARRIACNIPRDLQDQVTTAELVGHQLHKHMHAAITATDMLKRNGILKPANEDLAGWLTFEIGKTITTRYYISKDGVIYRFAEADHDTESEKNTNAKAYPPLVPANSEELALLNARKAALGLKMTRCTSSFNTIVLPYENAQTKAREIHVYLISPWTNNTTPLGGHHFIRYSGDGKTLLSKFSQTLACVNSEKTERENEEVVAMAVSHYSTDAPNAIHVYLSLAYQHAIFVVTAHNEIMWTVYGDQISVVGREDGKKYSDTSTTEKYDIKAKKEKKDDDFF